MKTTATPLVVVPIALKDSNQSLNTSKAGWSIRLLMSVLVRRGTWVRILPKNAYEFPIIMGSRNAPSTWCLQKYKFMSGRARNPKFDNAAQLVEST